jgi:hypothetical protein
MANSDVFRAMFSHANTKESREGRILIEDSTLTAVHQMLIFLYTAELPEEYDIAKDAAPLIKIANKYQIESLMEFNAQKLVDRFASKFTKKCHNLYLYNGHLFALLPI